MVRIVKQDAKVLVVEVDVSADYFEPSTSGKTLVTGTGGFLMVGGGLKLSLNCTKPNPDAPKTEQKKA